LRQPTHEHHHVAPPQYFNIPIDTNFSSASHPLSILRTLALPSDFVAFKMDVDAPRIEQAVVEQVGASQGLQA
jgi:hypothetical protein